MITCCSSSTSHVPISRSSIGYLGTEVLALTLLVTGIALFVIRGQSMLAGGLVISGAALIPLPFILSELRSQQVINFSSLNLRKKQSEKKENSIQDQQRKLIVEYGKGKDLKPTAVRKSVFLIMKDFKADMVQNKKLLSYAVARKAPRFIPMSSFLSVEAVAVALFITGIVLSILQGPNRTTSMIALTGGILLPIPFMAWGFSSRDEKKVESSPYVTPQTVITGELLNDAYPLIKRRTVQMITPDALVEEISKRWEAEKIKNSDKTQWNQAELLKALNIEDLTLLFTIHLKFLNFEERKKYKKETLKSAFLKEEIDTIIKNGVNYVEDQHLPKLPPPEKLSTLRITRDLFTQVFPSIVESNVVLEEVSRRWKAVRKKHPEKTNWTAEEIITHLAIDKMALRLIMSHNEKININVPNFTLTTRQLSQTMKLFKRKLNTKSARFLRGK